MRRRRANARLLVAGLLIPLAVTGCTDSGTGPAPPSSGPIQLVAGTRVGKDVFPIGNTPPAGQGQPVSGLQCGIQTIAYHAHPHLSLFVGGEQIAIPPAIGIPGATAQGSSAAGGKCLYWIHTHDATGILHVEPPTSARLMLGQAFDLWGQPLSSTNVAGYQGTVTAYIDQKPYNGDVRAIRLEPGRQINLQVGTPTVVPPTYILPPNY